LQLIPLCLSLSLIRSFNLLTFEVACAKKLLNQNSIPYNFQPQQNNSHQQSTIWDRQMKSFNNFSQSQSTIIIKRFSDYIQIWQNLSTIFPLRMRLWCDVELSLNRETWTRVSRKQFNLYWKIDLKHHAQMWKQLNCFELM
jgi:hypothetical protein